ncbi:MAG: dihydroneopterin aldolase [Bacteroidia bacterium]|nr:dihydroneopterin aldolase [Bacteroidia bacterium]
MPSEQKHIIKIQNMEFYAFHGCMTEEGKIGGKYRVNVEIEARVPEALKSDELTDTVDYVKIYEAVNEEMGKRSRLIEHVASRIMSKLKKISNKIRHIKVEITKVKPPIEGNVSCVSFVLEEDIN